MARRLFFMAVFLAAWPCQAGFEGGPWEIDAGADRVLIFQPEYLPRSDFYCAFAVPGRPEEIFVSQVHPKAPSGATHWRPQGRPSDNYVYVLNLNSGEHRLMGWERFRQQELSPEFFHTCRPADCPQLGTRGAPAAHISPMQIRRKGRELFAAVSFEMKSREKTTFGMPSPIPFMGRQGFVEKDTYHSGTVFMEVFDRQKPMEAIVRFQKRFRNQSVQPEVRKLGVWAAGAEQPLLVVVEGHDYKTGRKGRILVAFPAP